MRMHHTVVLPVGLYSIFWHCLIKGTTFEKKFLNIKCVFWFSLQLLSETFLIPRRTEWGMIKKYVDFHVKYPLFLSDFNEIWIFSTDFRKIPNYQISWNLSSGNLVIPCRQRHEANSRSLQFYEHLKKTHHINEWMQDLVGEVKQLSLVGRLRMSGAHLFFPLHVFVAWTRTVLPLQAFSHSLEKHVVVSSCPSVCAYVSVRLPMDDFLWNFDTGNFLWESVMKIQIWFKWRKKYWAVQMKT